MEALDEDEKQLAQLIEEEKKNLKELREEVTKAKEQKCMKQEEYNQVSKEFADAYGIALSPGERYRTVALDGTQFQPTGVISGGSSNKAKNWDGNAIRKMWDRLNLLHEDLRNLHYTNAKRELDVEMISNKIIQLEFRLKFVQQQEKEEIITNAVQQQQEVPKNSSQKQQQQPGAQLPSERPNIPPMPSTSSALIGAGASPQSQAAALRWAQFSQYYQDQAPDVAAAARQNAELMAAQQQMNPAAEKYSNFYNQAALFSQPEAWQHTWQMQKIRRRIIYEEQLNTWEREVTAYENSQKKLARDAKHRELFENTFIELKEKREEKERNNRVEGSRISSLAQGGNGIGTIRHRQSTSTQIQINDQNEAELEQKRQQAALIPPLYSNPPRRFFDNSNGLEDNSVAETQKQLEISQTVWKDTEKAVFTEKIALYPKNFAAIATFLPTKTVKECVHFYYKTKKQNNYKKTFRQRRKKKTGRQGYRPPIMPRFADTNGNSKLAKRPYPQQQQKQSSSSSNQLPTSTICQPPPEKKKKRIDVDAINILAKAQGLKKLDSYSNEQRNNILKMFFEKHNYEYIQEDFVQALYQFSIKQRKQIVQTSAGTGSGPRNNE